MLSPNRLSEAATLNYWLRVEKQLKQTVVGVAVEYGIHFLPRYQTHAVCILQWTRIFECERTNEFNHFLDCLLMRSKYFNRVGVSFLRASNTFRSWIPIVVRVPVKIRHHNLRSIDTAVESGEHSNGHAALIIFPENELKTKTSSHLIFPFT